MTNTRTICITILLCWLALMGLLTYYISQGHTVNVIKTIEVSV